MKLLTGALDLLFPPKCPFCAAVLERPGDPVCPKCQPVLPWLEHRAALRKVDFTKGCWSPLEYKDRVRECIHRYKFTPNPAYGKPLGKLMAQCAADHPEIGADVVLWAPLSRRSLRRRGFDQAKLLARTVADGLGLPLVDALEKCRETGQQSLLEEKSQRRANVQGAYRIKTGVKLTGKRVLLVDDVVTSGATLSACAQVLRAGGVEEVWCLTLAQAGK